MAEDPQKKTPADKRREDLTKRLEDIKKQKSDAEKELEWTRKTIATLESEERQIRDHLGEL